MHKAFAVFAFVVGCATSAAAFAAPPAGAPQLPPQPKVHPAGIPADAVMLSPCIAAMGEHWANLKDMPTGPIYGTYEGKPIFSEIMVSVEQFKKGFSYDNLKPLPGYKIDHVNLNFEPNGHPGFPVPHYDLHAYYITYAQQRAMCPNGIPNPSMKATNM